MDLLHERYSRQVSLAELGIAGQQKLLQARVLVVGAGGLGAAALQYLAAAGVGHLGIVDDDSVALHNLHRQPLYSMADIGAPKANTARSRLQALNPGINIIAFNERLTVANALQIISTYDIVIDGTDNFATRYLINDACVLLQKPLVYAAVSKYEGQVSVFNVPKEGMAVNYRDLFPQPPAPGEVANCAETGVLGVLPGIMGVMQAAEAIKLITGIGEPLVNRLFTYNVLNNQVFEWKLQARQGTADLIPATAAAFEKTDYQWLCGMASMEREIDSNRFDQLAGQESTIIIDVREPGEEPLVDEFAHEKIPLGRLSEQAGSIRAENILVFCQSGKRSLQAARLLAEQLGDATKIYSLAGGIVQWKKAREHKKQASAQ
ncbi:MAG TPA: HesA/MoeB/ThiF family protein [Chitinophagaceae bacterium]|nr:HesA/MoeB/ThiF family protein [Chitinophagaceae bacterium]